MCHIGHTCKAYEQTGTASDQSPGYLPAPVNQHQGGKEKTTGRMAADERAVVVALVGHHSGTAKLLGSTKVLDLVRPRALPMVFKPRVNK